MFKRQELKKYHESVRKDSSEDFLQLGFFNNNHILFVGQNPGEPRNERDRVNTRKIFDYDDYYDHEKKYCELIKNSLISKYFNKIVGENWNHVSMTNLVKVPTIANSVPSSSSISFYSKILEEELKYLNPNLIVAMGKMVCDYFGVEFGEFKQYKECWVLGVYHPSFLMRTGKMIENCKEVKDKIDDFCCKRALVKVNSTRIYYRDSEFKKLYYKNHHNSFFFFVEDEDGRDGVSYHGKNLKKIKGRNEEMYPDTYEDHLTKKDVFYYETYGVSQHSKIVKYVVFDIENEMSLDVYNAPKKILSIAWWDNIERKYCISVLQEEFCNIEGAKVFNDEKCLIQSFLEYLRDADVVIGWNSDQFDVPYLVNRAKKLGLFVENYFENFFIKFTEDFRVNFLRSDNITFIDALNFYKAFTYYDKPPNFKLNTVANFLFGEEKIVVDGLMDTYKNNIVKFLKYNLRDVELCKRIIDVASVIDYSLKLQQICPQDMINVFYNSKTIENMLHQRHWNKKVFFPSKREHDKVDFKGAIVLDPVKGIHSHVCVFDFSAMYTTIYISMNYSPDTLIFEESHKGQPQNVVVETDIGVFEYYNKFEKKGILPALEEEMLEKRNQFKKERDMYDYGSVGYKVADELQGTFKTILNSIYGVVGFERFILFNPAVPASVTATARKLIEFVVSKASEHGHSVLYGDTDSVFIKINGDSTDQIVLHAKSFERQLNKDLGSFMTQFTSDNRMKNSHNFNIEFEKMYEKLALSGVKKRYYGMLKYRKGKVLKEPELSVTGFETRRDDTPEFFKKRLEILYKKVLTETNREIKLFVECVKREVYQSSVEDLIIRIKLAQDPTSYKHLPIHARAVRNSGVELRRGDTVNMIYVRGGLEVVHWTEKSKYSIDYLKYFEKFFKQKIRLASEDLFKYLYDHQRGLASWVN